MTKFILDCDHGTTTVVVAQAEGVEPVADGEILGLMLMKHRTTCRCGEQFRARAKPLSRKTLWVG